MKSPLMSPVASRALRSKRLVVATILLVGAVASARAQSGRSGDIQITDGPRRYLLGRWAEGRLSLAAPCIAADTPAQGAAMTLSPAASLEFVQPRQVKPGSEEWTRVAPALLALAARREQEQRLAPAAPTRGRRFLDWLFAGVINDRVTHYFEASRRVPSPPIEADAADADPPSTLRIVVSGFARLDGTEPTPLGTKAELHWEEDGRPRGPQRPALRPLGIVPAEDAVWIMEGRTRLNAVIQVFSVGSRGTSLVGTTRIGRC